ncbi:hypothetical protein LOS78_05660 [Paracoccus sp. MA]|uniref:hypothetical protein n=1 Tax=Paracoccus sp. MA TaxID=2895796 RepID=UPI001E537B67|nr:hypothetical protein [Paracoccus sp. MA]UFM63651.1 hypothetical protein LOS78_05660 [Paracoccus sp. MA]
MIETLTDEQCDQIADAILRASGSALRHYTLQKSRDDIRAAVRLSVSQTMENCNAHRD